MFQVNTSDNSAGAKLNEIPENKAMPWVKNVSELLDIAPERTLSLEFLRTDTVTELVRSETETLFPYASVN